MNFIHPESFLLFCFPLVWSTGVPFSYLVRKKFWIFEFFVRRIAARLSGMIDRQRVTPPKWTTTTATTIPPMFEVPAMHSSELKMSQYGVVARQSKLCGGRVLSSQQSTHRGRGRHNFQQQYRHRASLLSPYSSSHCKSLLSLLSWLATLDSLMNVNHEFHPMIHTAARGRSTITCPPPSHRRGDQNS